MSRKINVSAELSRKLEGLDQAVQHLVAPVITDGSKLHGAFRDTGPVGAVVVQRVGEFHPAVFFCFF